ncbi:hypothetical protein P3T26_001260 [Streptomyces sp. MAA16]|nr:hypothetical protein [Streptomyces sp. MAA16]
MVLGGGRHPREEMEAIHHPTLIGALRDVYLYLYLHLY